MKQVFLNPTELELLKKIFSGNYEVILFGSRAQGSHGRFSDIDICLKSNQPIPAQVMSELKAQCSESNLPYTVDILDYQTLDPSFRKIVDQTGIIIKNFHQTS